MHDQSEKRNLLLADDSVTIQKVVNLTFADEGIDVTSVGDGNSALELIVDEAPDIILADVNMPGLNGYEICERVKNDSRFSEIPVVLLVGSFEPFDEDEAEKVKADGYLTKPFQSISQLVEKVHTLLEGEGDEAESVESVESVESETVEFETTESVEVETPEPFEEEKAGVAEVESSSSDREEETPIPQMSFPSSFEGTLEVPPAFGDDKKESLTTHEEAFDLDLEADESEMSEAFLEDDYVETFDASLNDDDQIEEVTTDFLKTQPLDRKDLKELDVDRDETYEPVSTSRDTGDLPTDFIPVPEEGVETEFSNLQQGVSEEPAELPEEKFEEIEVAPSQSPSVVPGESLEGESGETGEHLSVEVETDESEDFTSVKSSGLDEKTEEEHRFESVPGIADQLSETDTLEMPEVPEPEVISGLTLDESNLLELPTLPKSEQKVELNEEESAEVDRLLDSFDQGNDAGSGNIGNGADDFFVEKPRFDIGGTEDSFKKRLPQDTVELITHRVIEALSEKAIRDIAWEVVPEMAEIIIKKMAQEELEN